MSATEFTVDRRDIDFVLFEQLDTVGTLTQFDRFADYDRDLYDSMIDEAQKLAVEVTAPINAQGDRVGVKLDGEGNVTTPPGFKEAWKQLTEGGWLGLTAGEEWGGTAMPHVVGVVVSELMTGANVSFSIYSGLTVAAANLLVEFGPDEWRETSAKKLYAGEWGGTMCLTEADAGSAVGDNRCKAERMGDGLYHLTGEKVFISSGDHDLTDNIIHLVLARTPDAPTGIKGLSLFLVPKFEFDPATGALGDRNGAVVTGVEEKMGIHASATCTLTLGQDKPCKGYLLGEEGQGIQIMFHMMNEARIGVGIQGMAAAAAAYNYALSYAKERIQGTDIKDLRDADARRVTIVEHPDVRRMLMLQKVLVETMRSLLYTTALRVDRAENVEDKEQAEYLLGLVGLMTPICKAHCSDMGFEVCRLSIQTFGGYGYIGEYPVEQVMRDQKIFSLYEGTNGIQAMDLLGRKMRTNNGALFMAWLNECNQEIERCREAGFLDDEVTSMEKARDSLGGAAMHLAGLGMQGNVHGAMLQASPFLEQFGTVVLGLHALWQARIAKEELDAGASGADEAFYKGKILNAKFYCSTLLPRAVSLGKTITMGDESCLDEVLFR